MIRYDQNQNNPGISMKFLFASLYWEIIILLTMHIIQVVLSQVDFFDEVHFGLKLFVLIYLNQIKIVKLSTSKIYI